MVLSYSVMKFKQLYWFSSLTFIIVDTVLAAEEILLSVFHEILQAFQLYFVF